MISHETSRMGHTKRQLDINLNKSVVFVDCLTSQLHASESQGPFFSDKYTSSSTEIELAYQTFYHTQSQYTDTGPASPMADPITPDAWRGSHWNSNFEVTGMT